MKMNLRQARKILNRIDYIEFYDLPRPKSFRSMLHRKIKAEAVYNHFDDYGRFVNLWRNENKEKFLKRMRAGTLFATGS